MESFAVDTFTIPPGTRDIKADDRAGVERLLRYRARPPFVLQRLETIDAQRLIYHLSKPQPDGHKQAGGADPTTA